MTAGSSRAGDEAQIRGLIDSWAEAIRAKDVDAVMSHFAADIVTRATCFSCPLRRLRS